MRKILYSPGFGAGWSTWMRVPTKFACEYQPIIDALEKGEKLLPDGVSKYRAEITDYHPAVQLFAQECKDKFDYEPYLGGIENLCIYTCDDDVQVRISEYDGNESVHLKSKEEYF